MTELKFVEHGALKNPKYLVIFLHGYGANGENLLSLHHEFSHVLPESHYISPHGVEPWEGGFPDSYQWFSLNGGLGRNTLEQISESIKNSNKILGNFIDTQLARFNLSYKNLFIVGFSQGGMMSIYQGLIQKQQPAGIISFSGKLIMPEMIGEKTISKPNICLIHGKQDSVVPFENFIEAEKILKSQNFNFESHAVDHLDHSIDIHGVKSAQNFIKKLINQKNI